MEPLIDKGIALIQARDYSGAVSVLQDATKQMPENINAVVNLGQALEKLQEFAKARSYYQQALSINPNTVQAHQGLARIALRGPHYLEVLKLIHANLQPATYVEIGIREGASFKLAAQDIIAIGIDPNPLVDAAELSERHLVIQDTSDNYFQSGSLSTDLGNQPVDLAFIDGMHLFEFALRDFIALEKSAHPDATVLVHDCYPLNELTARREQETYFWSGDIWKLILCLKQYRPDLEIITLPCPPTGLAAITHLDPLSTVLSDSLETIYNNFITMDFSAIENDRETKLNLAGLIEAQESFYLKE